MNDALFGLTSKLGAVTAAKEMLNKGLDALRPGGVGPLVESAYHSLANAEQNLLAAISLLRHQEESNA